MSISTESKEIFRGYVGTLICYNAGSTTAIMNECYIWITHRIKEKYYSIDFFTKDSKGEYTDYKGVLICDNFSFINGEEESEE